MTILSELTSKKPNPVPPCLVASSSTSRVSAREGEDALLVVYKAPGSGPIIHMSWARGSRQLVGERYRIGENNNTVHLNLQGITKEDEGEYTVTAKNIAGESQSAVQLRVKDNSEEDDTPIFLRRLNDLSVKVGTRTRFLVEIRSSSDIKVTWYRNDLPIPEEERFHFLHEGNFFCIDVAPVTVEDGGRWACVAENQAGRSSCSCRLNVLIPKAYKSPEFLEELRAILTNQGTVSLECKVVGVPTPVLKWFKDGKEIKAGDVFALTANPDDPTSLGTYTCEAVNCMGKTYSSSRVHVMGKGSREGSLKPADYPPPTGPPPHFSQELKNEKVKIGSGLTLSCQVTVPPWPKSIQWYNKEGKVEPSEKYHIMEDGLGGYSIEICPLEACDEGEWKCVAMSDAGVMGISQCTVFMSYPKNYRKPKFLESLKAILTEEGLVSFECKVVGFPTPQLQWFKDGQELRPGDVYQLTGTNSLGSYSCIAKNCMGEARSTAELTVEDIQGQLNDEEKLLLFSKNQPPRFIRGLKSSEAKINEDFRFTVQVTIVPEPTLTWYKDDEKIEKTDRCTVVRENLGTCHLDIKKLEMTDQAEWKCVATNDFGQSVTSGFLKLTIPKHYKKPRFLECLRAILTEEGAVNLECKVIGVPQPTLKWYKDGKELKPGDIHKIISGQDGTCCLGTYTCEAHNCMGTVSSSASLLGFEDRMAIKESAIYKPELQYNLAKNTSLSTINEERTSQMYDTPMSERSVTMDERGDVSFSFDGKEVSISLYETPDLTEDEALQVVEMYAEELSEHVSEQNVVELPPLRFTKESSKSGPLLMEAVVIDVTPDYFSSAEEDLRTEADFEDVSMSEETSHGVQSPPGAEDEAYYEKVNADFLEKALTNLSAKKPSQDKSSGSDKDSYKSLSDHKKDDGDTPEIDRRGSKKGSQKTKRSRSQSQSFDENVEGGVVTVVPKRKSVSRSSSGGSSDKPSRKKSKSESIEQETIIADVPKKPEEKVKRKSSRTSSESTDETLMEGGVKKVKRSKSKSKSVEKENVAPKAPARKKKTGESKMEEETSGRGSLTSEEKKESDQLVQSSSTSGIRKKRSSGSPSVGTEEQVTDVDAKKRKTGRSRSSSRDKTQKQKEEKPIEPPIEAKEATQTDSKPKGSLLLLKNVKTTLQDIQTNLTNVSQQIESKCAGEPLPPTADYATLSKPVTEIQNTLTNLNQTLSEETTEIPTFSTLQSIDRLLQDFKTGLNLLDERKQTTEIGETLEIFSLVLNHLQTQLVDLRSEPEGEKAVGLLTPLSTPINNLNTAIETVKGVLSEKPKPDKSAVSVELLQILAQPVQELQKAIESGGGASLTEPIRNLQSAVGLLQQYELKERKEDSVSRKILHRLAKPLDKIFNSVQQGGHVENLSEPIQILHKELAKMVQEMLFPPQKSQSPYGESLPVLQKLSQSTGSILTNLTESETVPATVQQKRQIFSPIFDPLTELKTTIDNLQSGNEIPGEIFSSQLEKLDNRLSGIQANLENVSEEVKNEINQENLIQNVKEIRNEILAIFQGAEIDSAWKSLLGSFQKLNLNLSWKKPGEKPRQLLKKSSSSLGKSLEIIRQTSEEHFEVQAEEPRMSLAVLRPLEKPLQDLEEGFGVLVKHILEKERLTDEEKPAVEGQLHDLLEILSQSFESFQEKWVEIDGGAKSTLQESNILLSLVKELHDGANAIQFQMAEFETISSKASDVIRKNIYSNLKNLTGSIAEVEREIRKESMEAVPDLKTLKTTVENLQQEIKTMKTKTPEEAKVLQKISQTAGKLLENLEKVKYKPATEENPIWDQVVQKSLLEFQQELSDVEKDAKSKINLQDQPTVENVLQGAVDLIDNLQQQNKQLKVETLPHVTSSLEEFKSRIKPSATELLSAVQRNLQTAQNASQPEIQELVAPLQNLQGYLLQMSEIQPELIETLLQPFRNLQHWLEIAEKLPPGTAQPLLLTAEEIQEVITRLQAQPTATATLQNVIEPLQRLSTGLAQITPQSENALQEVVRLIKVNLSLVEEKQMTKPEFVQPLRQLQWKLEEMNEQLDETTTAVVSHLIKPLKELEKGLLVYEIVPGETAKELQAVEAKLATPLMEVEKGIAKVQQQIEGKEELKQLLAPLKLLQAGVSETLHPETAQVLQVSMPGQEKLVELIEVVEKDIVAVKKIEVLQAQTGIQEPLQALKAKLVEVAVEGKADAAAVEVLEGIVKPLQQLQMGLENAEQLKIESVGQLQATSPFSAIATPLMEIQQQISIIEAQVISPQTNEVLQEVLQPLHDLQVGITQFLQTAETTGELKPMKTPEGAKLTELIQIVEKNVASIQHNDSIQNEAQQLVIEPLKTLQAKLTEVSEGSKVQETVSVLEGIVKPLQDLQMGLEKAEQLKTESVGELQSTSPLSAIATPLMEIQQQISTIEAQVISTQTNEVLQEVLQPLHDLQVGIVQLLQPLLTAEELKVLVLPTAEKITEVIHNVERNVAELQTKQILTEQAKEALTAPLQALDAKLVEVAQLQSPNVQTVTVLENLSKPLQQLQESLQKVEQTQSTDSLATPLKEIQTEIAAIESQALSIPQTTAENLQEVVQPLRDLQAGIAMILQPMETTQELSAQKTPTEKLTQVIHLIEKNVATLETKQPLTAEVLTEPLKTLEAKLVEVAKMQKPETKTVTVLESLSQPMEALQKSLESFQQETTGELKSAQPSTELAVPLTEIQKDIATIQEQTALEMSKPTTTQEDKNLLKELIEPLQKLQTGIAQMLSIQETTAELKPAETQQKEKLSEVLHLVELNVATVTNLNTIDSATKLGLIEPLQSLQAKLTEATAEGNLQAVTSILENLVKPLQTLETGWETVQPITSDILTAIASPLLQVQQEIAVVQEQTAVEMGKHPEKVKALESVVEPLEQLQIALTQILESGEVSKAPELAHAVVILDKSLSALQSVETLQQEVAKEFQTPLEMLKPELEKAQTAKLSVEVGAALVEGVVKPLQHLQESLESIKELKTPTATALATPLEEIEKGVAIIQQQIIIESEKQKTGKENCLEVLKAIVQPLSQLTHETVGELQQFELPKSDTIKEVIQQVDKDIATIAQNESLESVIKQTTTEPLKALRAKLQEVDQLDEKSAVVIENLLQPLKQLEGGLATAEVVEPLSKVIMEAQQSQAAAVLVEPLQQLQISLSQISETTGELKPPEAVKLQAVITEIGKNLALVNQQEVFEDEQKLKLSEPLKLLQAKVTEVAEKEKPEVKVVKVLENLMKPLSELEEGLKSAKTVEIQTALDSVTELAQQVQLEPQASSMTEPLQQLQSVLTEIIQKEETTGQLTQKPPETAKLSEAIHLVKMSVTAVEQKQLQSTAKIIEPLKALQAKLEQLTQSPQQEGKIMQAIENLLQPLEQVEKGLESPEEITTALATPLIEMEKQLAITQKQTALELNKPEQAAVVQEILQPLQQFQASLAEAIQSQTVTATIKEVINAVERNVATIQQQEVIQPEAKQTLTEPLTKIQEQLKELSNTQPDEKLLENLIKPLSELEKGFKTNLTTEPEKKAVLTPLQQAQKGIASIQQQTENPSKQKFFRNSPTPYSSSKPTSRKSCWRPQANSNL